MSRLNELLQELCPNGVAYSELKNIAQIAIGEFVHKNKQTIDGQYPVYNGGTTNTGFYDDFNRTANKIIISARGASAGYVNRVFTNFWSGNSCYSVDITDNNVDWNYAYYCLKSGESKLLGEQQKGSIPAVSKKQVEQFRIPLPPLPVQQEIVRILDSFTELMAELTAELTARQKQYEHYQTVLLSPLMQQSLSKIGDVCNVEKGNTPIQKATPGKYPLVVTAEQRQTSASFQFNGDAVCIPLVSARGHGVASINQIYYQTGKFALGNILCAIQPRDNQYLSAKFLKHYLFYYKDILLVPLMRGGANVSLTVSSVKSVRIPIPPLVIQQRIVEILDRFDALCNDLTSGLPAEIAARQKQYEYYRDKLLTFQEKKGE